MKRLLLLTSGFILAIAAGSYWKATRLSPPLTIDQERHETADERERDGEEGEEKQSGAIEFLKYESGIRTREDQTAPGYPKNYAWNELTKARTSAAKRSSTTTARVQGSNGVLSFTERGPGNVPGRTRGLIADPDDATHKTWFAGSAGGGIWKTTNAGTTWQWLTPNIPNLATTTLAMASSNHNVIYAGTGEGFGLVDGISGSGIFKTTDRGSNWSFLSSTSAFTSVNRIVVNPSDEKYVLAATNDGIYKSTDGGSTWTKVYNAVVQDLRDTPGNFSILYGTVYGVGVIKSTDSGATWNLSNTGMSPSGRIEIGVSPVNTQRIIASAEGSLSGGNSDLYYSLDGGATWGLTLPQLSAKSLDYLSSQGWYDNTVAFSPYDANVVYVGGIGVYQITLGNATATFTSNYALETVNTSSFLLLQSFSNVTAAGGALSVGSSANADSIGILFGPGLSQMAHRFLVPAGKTSGVATSSYTYADYVSVPFQVWNLKTNTQLMVSFRDQDRNGVFDLIAQDLSNSDATKQSREYLYIHSLPYATSPNATIAVTGGIAVSQMYNIFPALASGGTWTPNSLPTSKVKIEVVQLPNYATTVSTVNDPYSNYDGKNNRSFVHPDQHNVYPIKVDDVNKTFQLLLANDGGIYLSRTSTSPGTTQGEWTKVGNGYNTSQFYGADKKPGAMEYLGGMQDNATYFTPAGKTSSASTAFSTDSQLAGDGFEALWHSQNPNYMIGSSQYAGFSRSTDGGATWTDAISGLTLSGSSPDATKFPFISKLANSKQAPDFIYTVGSEGVWRSTNFGGNWTLSAITSNWGLSSYTDVEVSRANANIVWAGAGFGSSSNLFVSKDKGVTFTAVPNPAGMVLGNLTRIATHPTEPNTVYVLFSFANTPKVIKSTDLGQTWKDLSGFTGTGTSSNNFPDVAVYSLYVRPDNPNIIWVGSEIGIVESLDAGATWNLLTGYPTTGFPNVAVWDMKGQDNQIVIATHGRGIWTAELSVDQNAGYPVPVIAASGTSPQGKFVVQANLATKYDSITLLINSQPLTFKPSQAGTYNLNISNVSAGSVSLQMIGYIGASPIYSLPTTGTQLSLKAYQNQYYDYFTSATNFSTNGITLQTFGTSNSSLQTKHNYTGGTDASATLLVPIMVNSTGSTAISYQDVAIVDTQDNVIAEGTKDGVTWLPLVNSYNASANTTWSSALTNGTSGNTSMSVTESSTLTKSFAGGDTILVRFRLHSVNASAAAWGWSVDNLYIQVSPTEVSTITDFAVEVYPNPTDGAFTVKYSLTQPSDVGVQVWDMTGREVVTENLQNQSAGDHEMPIELRSFNGGVYLVRLRSADGSSTTRIVKR